VIKVRDRLWRRLTEERHIIAYYYLFRKLLIKAKNSLKKDCLSFDPWSVELFVLTASFGTSEPIVHCHHDIVLLFVLYLLSIYIYHSIAIIDAMVE